MWKGTNIRSLENRGNIELAKTLIQANSCHVSNCEDIENIIILKWLRDELRHEELIKTGIYIPK